MVKGNIVTRRNTRIRQYVVTVDAAARLVNSGDLVDRRTYEALVAAGVFGPPPEVETHPDEARHPSPKPTLFIED